MKKLDFAGRKKTSFRILKTQYLEITKLLKMGLAFDISEFVRSAVINYLRYHSQDSNKQPYIEEIKVNRSKSNSYWKTDILSYNNNSSETKLVQYNIAEGLHDYLQTLVDNNTYRHFSDLMRHIVYLYINDLSLIYDKIVSYAENQILLNDKESILYLLFLEFSPVSSIYNFADYHQFPSDYMKYIGSLFEKGLLTRRGKSNIVAIPMNNIVFPIDKYQQKMKTLLEE